MPATRKGLWSLAAVVAAGLAAMAVLRALHDDTETTTDMVEILNKDPVALSPFVDETGKAVSVEDFRGKVLILNLWAPWCVPCLKEMPSRPAARLPANEFAVVAVTKDPVGDSPSKRTFEAMKLTRLKLYLDPKGLLEHEIGSRGYPTTLILGRDGAPLALREGAANWDSDEMVAKLEKLATR